VSVEKALQQKNFLSWKPRIFRRIPKIAKSNYQLHIWPHETTWVPLERSSWNL